MEEKIKVLAASVGAALMLGATLAGAMAANLGNLPAPFVENHQLKAKIVVGETAQPADIIAAATIAAALGEYLVSAEAATTGGSITTGAGYKDDFYIGDAVTKTMTPALYPELLKFDKISFYGADKKTHDVRYAEKLDINGNIERGYDVGATNDDAYYDKTTQLYFAPTQNGVKYYIEFKDDEITNATVDDTHPAIINMLGKQLKIIDVGMDDNNDYTTSWVTVRTGEEVTLSVGQSKTVQGLNIEVVNVYENNVVGLKINGQDYTISRGDKETVNNIEVMVDDVLIPWDPSAGVPTVKLLVGEKTEETYKYGDPYIGEDDKYPTWVWDVKVEYDNTANVYKLKEIGVMNKEAMNDITSDYANKQPIEMGKELAIAGSDIVVKLVDTKVKDMVKYDISVDGDEVTIKSGWTYGINDGTNYVDELVLKFNETALSLEGNSEQTIAYYVKYTDPTTGDEVWKKYTISSGNSNVDEDFSEQIGNWVLTLGDNENDVMLRLYGHKKVDTTTPTYNVTVYGIELDFPTGVEDVRIPLTYVAGTPAKVYLGSGENDDAKEVLVFDGVETKELGNAEYDYMTKYGAIIEKGYNVNDKITIEIPKAQQEVTFYAGKKGGDVATTTETQVTIHMTPLANEVAKLDTEITEADTPLIIVGGPAVNLWAKKILGDDREAWKSFFGYDETTNTGKGVIAVYDADEVAEIGQPVLLVAGWEAPNTRAAAYVLAKYLLEGKVNEWEGKTKVFVVGEQVTTATVEAE